LIAQAAQELGASTMSLPSGAGHDAMVLSRHVPSAMLFVPSIGGRSHHVSEDTSEADIVLGARVLLRVVELVMNGRANRPA
jgi:beta-ureidopropionase / N-carbamoyl-L-amino-acid hydrolase